VKDRPDAGQGGTKQVIGSRAEGQHPAAVHRSSLSGIRFWRVLPRFARTSVWPRPSHHEPITMTDHLRPGRHRRRVADFPQWFPSWAHAMKAAAVIKREASGMTKVYLALLRGINVGGKNKVPMAELKACFEELGCENVRTYIASGNVMFESNKSSAELTEEIQEALPTKFRLDSELIRILVLSRDQLQKVIDQAPKGFGTEPGKYHSDAIFLIGIPSDEAIKVFNPREGVDKVWQGDLAIYSRRLSAQRTRSRLSKMMSSPLYKQMTIRSWDTTARLLELMNAVER
jgi:uncharacterized protein (DUF1697 family)